MHHPTVISEAAHNGRNTWQKTLGPPLYKLKAKEGKLLHYHINYFLVTWITGPISMKKKV